MSEPRRGVRVPATARHPRVMALGVVVLVGLACGRTALTTPAGTLTLGAVPSRLTPEQPTATLSVRALTARGEPGRGIIELQAAAGMLASTMLPLDEEGHGRATLRCSPREDARCHGTVRVEALWLETGVEATIAVVVEGIDAGPGDAGASDAGVLDAGPSDAGTPDAGTSDAGASDAGASDAGTLDGGQPLDAGFSALDMYLMGTLSPGLAGRDVFCLLADAGFAWAGFEGHSGSVAPAPGVGRPTVRPADGALYYRDGTDAVLRRFAPDVLFFDGSTAAYPRAPRANDPVISTPGCTGARISAFLIQPDGGLLHRCTVEPGWRDATGSTVATCETVRSFSLDGASFCDGPIRQQVLDASGTMHPLSVSTRFFTVRSRPGGGFWGATVFGTTWERWSITTTGIATRDGVWATRPAGFVPVNGDVPGWAELDGAGNFYRWGFLNGVFNDAVARFPADFSDPSVVYEENAPGIVCKFHAGDLTTGP